MNIILIGNYLSDRQSSMQLFCSILADGLAQYGCSPLIVRPSRVFGNLLDETSKYFKWFAYLDKFVVFPIKLCWVARKADVVHICDHSNAMYGKWLGQTPWLVTCHDLLAVRSALNEFPQNRTGLLGKILQKWIRISLGKAPIVVSVSNATQKDLGRIIPCSSRSSIVIANGLNFAFQPIDRRTASLAVKNLVGVRQEKPYLLHVGGETWYKNRVFALDVFRDLLANPDARDLELIMVGPPTPSVMQKITDEELRGRVHILQGVSPEQLNALYAAAEALVFPSLAEGFGWPVLEAMASGCLVATSRRPPMTEVGGDAAAYFEPDDSRVAAKVLEQLIFADAQDRERRVALGLVQASKFSTNGMIARYVEVYRKLVGSVAAD